MNVDLASLLEEQYLKDQAGRREQLQGKPA